MKITISTKRIKVTQIWEDTIETHRVTVEYGDFLKEEVKEVGTFKIKSKGYTNPSQLVEYSTPCEELARYWELLKGKTFGSYQNAMHFIENVATDLMERGVFSVSVDKLPEVKE